MNPLKTVEEKSQQEEWGAWKFVSEMFDVPHPDKDLAKAGIYNTSKCYEQIYDFVVVQKEKAITQDRQATLAALVTALERKKHTTMAGIGLDFDEYIHNQALDQAITIVKELLTPTV